MEIYLAAKTQLLAKRWAENLHRVSYADTMGLSTPILRHHIVLTQSFPMNRYLQNFASNNSGIAMGLLWTKPWLLIKTLHSLFLQESESIQPPLPLEDPFSKEALRLRIARVLVEAVAASHADTASNKKGSVNFISTAKKLLFPRIENVHIPTKVQTTQQALSLAIGLADAFDQYFVYRPEFFKKWENTYPRWKKPSAQNQENTRVQSFIEIENFQHELWKVLKAEISAEVAKPNLAISNAFSRTEQIQELLQVLQTTENDAIRQKFFMHFSHLSVFGVTNLPPSMLEILQALDDALQQGDGNQTSAISFFLLNCNQPDTNASAISEIHSSKKLDEEDFNFDLSPESLTDQFSRFFLQLCALSKKQQKTQNNAVKSIDETQSSDTANLLTAVKSYFSSLDRPTFAQTSSETPSYSTTGMAIMQCRDREQEVQTLANTILTLLKRQSEAVEGGKFSVNDILVMTPLVSDYGHLIRTIFPLYGLPFSITDESIPNTRPMLIELHRLLLLFSEEITPKSIVDVLQGEHFSQKQGLQPHIDIIKKAIEEFFIRTPHLDSLFAHESSVNSFSSGLARMLQSYAAYRYEDHQKISDKSAEILAIFFDTVDNLEKMRKQFLKARSIESWCDACHELVSRFLRHNSSDQDDGIFELLYELRTATTQSGGGNRPLELSLTQFRSLLEEKLSETVNERGFMVGRITVSSLLPMRSIPFRVIYLLGMDEVSFPRHTQHSQLSLVSKKPRAGDPQKEIEDRQILVESIVSALDHWFISFSVYQEKKGATKRSITPLMYDIFEKSSKNWIDPKDPLSVSKLLKQVTVDHIDAPMQDTFKEEKGKAKDAKMLWKKEYSTLQQKFAATTATARQDPSKQSRYSYIDEESIQKKVSSEKMENELLIKKSPVEKNKNPIVKIKLNELVEFFIDPIKKTFEKEGVWMQPAYQSTFYEHEPLEKISKINNTFAGDYTTKKLIKSYLKNPKFYKTPKLDWKDEAVKKQLPHGLAGRVAVKEINEALNEIYENIESLLQRKKHTPLAESLDTLAGHLFLEKTCTIELENCTAIVNGIAGPLLSAQCFVAPFYEKNSPHFPSWATIADWLLQTLFLLYPTPNQRWHNSSFSDDLPPQQGLNGDFFSYIVGNETKNKAPVSMGISHTAQEGLTTVFKSFINNYLDHTTISTTRSTGTDIKLSTANTQLDLPLILPLLGNSAVKYLMTPKKNFSENSEDVFHNEWKKDLEKIPQQWGSNLSLKQQNLFYQATCSLYEKLFAPLLNALEKTPA